MHDRIVNEYFEWMSEFVCDEKHIKNVSYRKLLMYLHLTKFRYPASIPNDGNRAADGEGLRYRFAYERGYKDISTHLTGPCSVLEMMVALAIRCEEQIMGDPDAGDRTAQWFWDMIKNLDLYSMTDKAFNKTSASRILNRFLDREYYCDGSGGLFTVPNCPYDLRAVEIWYQMCWYLNSIL